MAASYKQFLAAPSSSLLADAAALHYVTTTTSIVGPTQIIQHFNTLQKQLTKKKEHVLNLVDGHNVIVVEVDTGIEFKLSGGPYLPGLDDNFLASRTVYLPITHIVTFDEAGKIAQIRLQWDQGSLLKQVEVIGKSGRNWPIRDSREQISFIQSCLKLAGSAFAGATGPDHNDLVMRDRNNSQNALRDPYASLKLFGPREEIEAPVPGSVVSPYAGSRPRQRSFTEILGDEPVGADSPSADHHRSMSPSKVGGGKNFRPSRLFEGQEEQPEAVDTPKGKRYIRPNPKRFSHFDFADGTGPDDAPRPGYSVDDRPPSKRNSQWSFDDFHTPQKPIPSKTLRHPDARHWDTDKDAVGEAPVQAAAKPRRDSHPHFEHQDDGERGPEPDRPGAKPRGYAHNEGLGPYKNNEEAAADRALGNITNLQDRSKDFDTNDESFAHFVPEARNKAVKMMNGNWSHEPAPAAQKENRPGADNRIHIAGDGMGGRRGTNRDWLYGGEADDVAAAAPTRKPNAGPAQGENNPNARIHIAGDGMGGKKGTERDWLYGQSEADPAPSFGARKQPSAPPAKADEPTNARIHIAGDGMGGKKGTDRDWLYGQSEADPAPSFGARKQPSAAPAKADEPTNARIHIAGDGMGGKKGTDRDWLYGQSESDIAPSFGALKQPSAAPARATETTNARIHIAGDGMGGKQGTNRDWLYGDTTEAQEPAQSVPTRKPGATGAPAPETSNKRIHIAGDGMGGRKGTNRDWLYGEIDETQNQQPAPAKAAPQKGFWDF